jgi:lipid-A-disaccharide synthase
MAQKQILIICGEASGDLSAASLAKEILKINPDIKISAVGGIQLHQAGAKIIYDIKDLCAFGFFDVLKKLPKFFALKNNILKKIKQEKFAAIIFVDFSGFNLRLAKKINKTIPAIYYISPQVWASRQGRIKTIKKYISKMIVLFKFEEDFYKKFGMDVDFVGHPLLDIVNPSMKKEEFLNKFGLSISKTTIALLPGSRRQEIENILPVMLKSAKLISKEIKDVQFVIAKSEQVDWEIYLKITRGLNLNLEIIEGKTYDCLNIASFCLVCSGTATLETTILEKPFIIIYKMSLLNYLLYRPQVKVPYIGMVNIIAGRKIVPEFIQFQASPKKISNQVLEILENPSQAEQIKNNLTQIKSLLGSPGASYRAAKIIIDILNFSPSQCVHQPVDGQKRKI